MSMLRFKELGGISWAKKEEGGGKKKRQEGTKGKGTLRQKEQHCTDLEAKETRVSLGN